MIDAYSPINFFLKFPTKLRGVLYLLCDAVHNELNSIAYLVKGNIFCIVKITLILFPKVLELFAGTDFGDNLRVHFQHFISNFTSSAISTAQISSNISRIDSCVSVKPLTVVSKSIVALVSRPTIAEMRKPPFRIKLCLYFDREIRSSSLSSI